MSTPHPEYGDFDPDLPRDWEVWYCEDEGYALVPPDNVQAKAASQVKTLLGVFHALTYDQAKEKFTELCAAHNQSLSPPFAPNDTGHPAWVQCGGCMDYLCAIHEGHVHDCACPAIEDWPPEIDPYLTGGPPPEPEDETSCANPT